MASSSSSTNKTNNAEKKQDKSVILIHDDGHIVWRQSMSDNAPKDDSHNELKDILKQMGIEDCSAEAQTSMIRKFNSSVKKLPPNNGHEPPMLDLVLQVMKEWSPKIDLVCLYVRWAKKGKSNFHFDSISTLLTVANQCGYTPLGFLNFAKTLQVHPRRVRNSQGKFGVRFVFTTVKSKKVDNNFLTRQFAGLALTLGMLQSATSCCRGTFGEVGMRHSEPRTSSNISVLTNDGGKAKTGVHGFPLMEFHQESSLVNRLWLNIGHRWMALELVEHLFKPIVEPWVPQGALEFTFRMHSAGGSTRFGFLNPMVGFCLRFPDVRTVIANKRCLTAIWNDAQTFCFHGEETLRHFSHEERLTEIALTFKELQNLKSTHTYGRHTKQDYRAWLMLRGYIYHYWLEQHANEKLLNDVVRSLTSTNKKTKRKPSSLPKDLSPLPPKSARVSSPNASFLTPSTVDDLLAQRTASRNKAASGLMSLLASRSSPKVPPIIDK